MLHDVRKTSRPKQHESLTGAAGDFVCIDERFQTCAAVS